MNVFLVPAHPGCPGQNPESCKTFVVSALAVTMHLLKFIQWPLLNLIQQRGTGLGFKVVVCFICSCGFEGLILRVFL